MLRITWSITKQSVTVAVNHLSVHSDVTFNTYAKVKVKVKVTDVQALT